MPVKLFDSANIVNCSFSYMQRIAIIISNNYLTSKTGQWACCTTPFATLPIKNRIDHVHMFLERYRKDERADPLYKWIGTYNLKLITLLQFFFGRVTCIIT